MLYLLDANVLITANRLYYPLERVPEFWEWIVHQGNIGNVKIPVEILDEIGGGNDDLTDWISQRSKHDALCLDEEPDIDLLRRVMDEGYANDLADHEVEKIGRDPFLVAYALCSPADRWVVTTEVSKPNKQRANRHLPDICHQLQVLCTDTFGLIRELNFSTSWRNRGR